MFKLLKWLIILIVLVVVGGVVALYLSLGHILKSVVQTEGTKQLNDTVTLSSATLNPISGSVGFTNFALAAPAGFTSSPMFSVGSLKVDTAGVTHLRDKPLRVTTIQIDSPHLVVEQKGLQLNFQALMKGLPKNGEPSPNTTADNPTKLVIDTLSINNPTVDFVAPDVAGAADGLAAGQSGLVADLVKKGAGAADKQVGKNIKPFTATLPTITLKNLGNADGKMQGVEVKDIVTAVIQAMAADAAKQHNLPFDPSLLNGNLDAVEQKLGGSARDQIQKQAKNLPGGVGNLLNGALGGGK